MRSANTYDYTTSEMAEEHEMVFHAKVGYPQNIQKRCNIKATPGNTALCNRREVLRTSKKKLALEKLMAATRTECDNHNPLLSIKKIQTNTISTAQGLRNIVVELAAKNDKELLNEDSDFYKEMETVGKFGKDLVKHMSFEKNQKRQCADCKAVRKRSL